MARGDRLHQLTALARIDGSSASGMKAVDVQHVRSGATVRARRIRTR